MIKLGKKDLKQKYITEQISKLKSDMKMKYFIEFTLIGGKYSMIVPREKLDDIITWYNSDIDEGYTIKKFNGYLRLTKDNLIEFSWNEVTGLRQRMEPILYIMMSPIKYDLKAYFKVMIFTFLSIAVGMISYIYFKNIELTRDVLASIYKATVGFVNMFNIGFASIYTFFIIRRISCLNNDNPLSTYSETISFKTGSSIIFNGISIMIYSVFFQKLILMIFNDIVKYLQI